MTVLLCLLKRTSTHDGYEIISDGWLSRPWNLHCTNKLE